MRSPFRRSALVILTDSPPSSHSPYYIWLGRSRACDSNRISFTPEFDSNTAGNLSKLSTESNSSNDNLSLLSESSTDTLAQTEHVIDITPPLSSFQYQTSKVRSFSYVLLVGYSLVLQIVRMPYYEQPIHREFKTFIYSFTWVMTTFIRTFPLTYSSSGRSF